VAGPFPCFPAREFSPNGVKTRKNQRKLEKTCGNRPFAVDKGFQKTQGKRRWVLSDPHKHRASKLRLRGSGRWNAERKDLAATNRFDPVRAHPNQEETTMATTMTKTALVRHMAEKLELTNKQSAAFLDLLAETAIKETKKNGVFVIPGLGRLVKAERKARMGRNPQTGEQIKIKAKTVVKFRVAKAAKDVIAPPKK
jgi:DNA-binding protein HU-beta